MSDPLSVRRVKVQTINEDGTPEGKPSYGVMAATNEAQAYNDTFASLEELNQVINESGCILDIIDNADELFPGYNAEVIGTDNYYGKDWVWD
jgi:hypothetical protein